MHVHLVPGKTRSLIEIKRPVPSIYIIYRCMRKQILMKNANSSRLFGVKLYLSTDSVHECNTYKSSIQSTFVIPGTRFMDIISYTRPTNAVISIFIAWNINRLFSSGQHLGSYRMLRSICFRFATKRNTQPYYRRRCHYESTLPEFQTHHLQRDCAKNRILSSVKLCEHSISSWFSIGDG